MNPERTRKDPIQGPFIIMQIEEEAYPFLGSCELLRLGLVLCFRHVALEVTEKLHLPEY